MSNAYTNKIFLGVFGYEQPKYLGLDSRIENDVQYHNGDKSLSVNVGDLRWGFIMSIVPNGVRMMPDEVILNVRRRIKAEYERRAARYN
jgi:hypothetical protein